MKTKEFDLFKFMGVAAVCIIVALLLFQIDYSFFASEWTDFLVWTEQPFEWRQGHYWLILVFIVIYGKR